MIGASDATDLHHEPAFAQLRAATHRNDDLVLPASAYAEAMVGPLRRGGPAATILDELCLHLPIEVVALDAAIARRAAALRARHRALKLPDAFVIATAAALEADVLVTTDRRWPGADVLDFAGELVRL